MVLFASKPSLECKILNDGYLPAWDRFVAQHPKGTIYHFSIWRDILAQAFGKRWYLIAAMQEGEIRAGLPVVHVKSRLFGNFLVSMPYVNYGGLLTDEACLNETLLKEAIALGRRLGTSYLELRHLSNCCPQLPARQNKVSMWLSLPESAEQLMAGFTAKLRSQIRKGEKNHLTTTVGGAELLDDFYAVFSHNMRDLGTPVCGKRFFHLILNAFTHSSRLVVVKGSENVPLAAGFLLGYRERLEIPWASSLREFNHLQSNMWLYWTCLKYACKKGYGVFDFGRSTVDSSTYKFKEQWGTQPVPHYWHYYLNHGQKLPQLNPDNARFRLAISVWQRLPVAATQLIGPAIAKQLP
jgi:FemAB-related protein (PEP-CTERM system-associated)